MKPVDDLKRLKDLFQKAQKPAKRSAVLLLPMLSAIVLGTGISFLVWNTFHQQAQLKAFDWQVQQVTDVEKRLTLEKDRLTLENAVNATRAQVIGGILVFFTAFTAWRNLKVTEDKQVTERFSKAVEQLGHSDEYVRLGAIYSLERIANDSDKDYWQVMEILTAYVRGRSPWTKEKAQAWEEVKKSEGKPEIPPLKIDIQAVLTVLNRRKHSFGNGEKYPLDLRATDLRRADLRGAKMQGVWLMEAHLGGAYLMESHLEEADLRYAHLEEAYLEDAHLRAANLNYAHLEGANLNSIDLEGAKLYRTHLKESSLRDADLEKSELRYAHLEGADLYGAHLKGADLHRTRLEGASLRQAYLEGSDLREAHLEGADLRDAKGITPEQLATAKTNEYTKLDDLQLPQSKPSD